MTGAETDPLERALCEAHEGRFDAIAASTSALRTPTAVQSWALAHACMRWMAEPAGPPPPPFELEPGDPVASRGYAAALTALERACMLSGNVDGYAWLLERHRRHVVDERSSLELEAAELTWLVLDLQLVDVIPRSTALVDRAAASRIASLVSDAAAIRAWCALETHDLEAAVKLARRAARMARSDGLPQSEYLAYLVLARVRRVAGQPHLAAHILTALRRHASAGWHRWIDWELFFAGVYEHQPEHPAARVADALGDAERGGRAFDHAVSAPSWPVFRREAHFLAACVDPEMRPDDPHLAAWWSGAADAPPLGVHAACEAVDSDTEAPLAYAWADGKNAPRRILRPGVGLIAAPDAVQLARSQRRKGRLDTAAATLVLAGSDGLPAEVFFERVYGFPYVSSLHQGTLGMLVHRLRAHLGDAAAIDRDDDRVRLVALRPVLVPDPRCTMPAGGRILRELAVRGAGTAADLAQSLGIPLRTLQAELQTLVNDGVCGSQRAGRRIEYRVEDTTFHEPTAA